MTFKVVISIMPDANLCDLIVCLETDPADVSVDAGSEEAEDSDFWEGVTKPGSSKTTASLCKHAEKPRSFRLP